MTADDLREFQKYLANESDYYERYPQIFDDIKSKDRPRHLTENAIHSILKRLRTVVNWCLKHNITTNDPFATYEMPKVLDSPPFYLTLEERDKVYYADLSNETPGIQVYRDIFMFQCLIGCRVGDLEKMTRASIVDGAVQYIAEKTKNHQPRTIRVRSMRKPRLSLRSIPILKRASCQRFVRMSITYTSARFWRFAK